MSEATKESTPKELEIHQKWDQIIDLGLRRTVRDDSFFGHTAILAYSNLLHLSQVCHQGITLSTCR